ncbi:MAG: hypothetical protein PHN39_00900 [Candidatus Pacebacteria bacterium]|nr:hypothetical protein [Candidatus Paceibacterota bacterium]
MPKCKHCDQEFVSGAECFAHESNCTGTVVYKEISLIGANSTGEAAKAIAQALSSMRKEHPDKIFQVIPLGYNPFGFIKTVAIIG